MTARPALWRHLWSRSFGAVLAVWIALSAVAMIYRNLPLAYADGQNLEAREKMALASAYAGMAFTRANVGNVHAIAHQPEEFQPLPDRKRPSIAKYGDRLAAHELHHKKGPPGLRRARRRCDRCPSPRPSG